MDFMHLREQDFKIIEQEKYFCTQNCLCLALSKPAALRDQILDAASRQKEVPERWGRRMRMIFPHPGTASLPVMNQNGLQTRRPSSRPTLRRGTGMYVPVLRNWDTSDIIIYSPYKDNQVPSYTLFPGKTALELLAALLWQRPFVSFWYRQGRKKDVGYWYGKHSEYR